MKSLNLAVCLSVCLVVTAVCYYPDDESVVKPVFTSNQRVLERTHLIQIKARDAHEPAIVLAAQARDSGVVECLMSLPSTSVHEKDSKGNTALYYATINDYNLIVGVLMSAQGAGHADAIRQTWNIANEGTLAYELLEGEMLAAWAQ